MAALKAAPQPELEQHDNSVAALVEDSDDEDQEFVLPPPAPTPVVEKVVEKVVETPVPVEETKKKKVVSKKKSDA